MATSNDDIWVAIRDEREALAGLVRGLSPTQLEVQSLCGRWRVRHVVGHLLWVATTPTISKAGFRAAAAARLRPNVMIAEEGIRCGVGTADELADRLVASAGSRLLAPGLRPIGYLADVIVHGQDIRRPLGLPRDEIPRDRLVACLDHYLGHNSFTGGKTRTKGLRIVATDIDWSHGEGLEVRGPAEAILMAAVGRRAALFDLEGPGVATLNGRLAP